MFNQQRVIVWYRRATVRQNLSVCNLHFTKAKSTDDSLITNTNLLINILQYLTMLRYFQILTFYQVVWGEALV